MTRIFASFIVLISLGAHALPPVVPVAKLKAPSLINRLLRKASFAEEWQRYPAPDVLLLDLHAKFPGVTLERAPEQCRQLGLDNRTALGDSDPVTGTPAVDQPNAAFVKWYVGCLSFFINDESMDASFSIETRRACTTYDAAQGTACRYGHLPPRARRELAYQLALRFVGPPEVWTDLGLAATPEDFITALVNEVDDFEAKKDGRYAMVNATSSPLYVVDAIRILSLLINLQNTIKY